MIELFINYTNRRFCKLLTNKIFKKYIINVVCYISWCIRLFYCRLTTLFVRFKFSKHIIIRVYNKSINQIFKFTLFYIGFFIPFDKTQFPSSRLPHKAFIFLIISRVYFPHALHHRHVNKVSLFWKCFITKCGSELCFS